MKVFEHLVFLNDLYISNRMADLNHTPSEKNLSILSKERCYDKYQ